MFDCDCEMSFGSRLSSQIRSRRREAYFWLANRFI